MVVDFFLRKSLSTLIQTLFLSKDNLNVLIDLQPSISQND